MAFGNGVKLAALVAGRLPASADTQVQSNTALVSWSSLVRSHALLRIEHSITRVRKSVIANCSKKDYYLNS